MFHSRLRSFSRLMISLTLAAGLMSLAAGARAQDKRQNAPGEFDFYVLSLSWSPSFCEEAAERGGRSQIQCDGRPYAFVVLGLSQAKTVAPAEVEEAFIKANPGLSNAAVSVTCNRTRLSEVRICLSKDLQFRACEENDRRACRRDQLTMPPIRGG